MSADRATVAWDVRRFAEVDSTNRVAVDLARGGAPEGVVVVADHQTAGRGRLGRTWEAPAGTSLLVSFVLRPGRDVLPERSHLLTALVALAAADACAEVAGFRPELKWPNDLVVLGPRGWRKLAGILAESGSSGGSGGAGLDFAVVGLGCNVNWPAELPAELAELAVAANHVAGRPVDADALLEAVLTGVGDRYRRLRDPLTWPEVAQEYRARCATLGQHVLVHLGAETIAGQATELSDEGLLGVDVAGRMRWVAAGDVIHVRSPS